MRTRRRRYHRHGDMGRASAPENLYHEPRGEYGHRYSENMFGEPYGDYRQYGHSRNDNWDQNPGGGSYGYNHYSNHMDKNESWESEDSRSSSMDDRRPQNGRDDRSREEFRARNSRYRDRVRGYSRRRDTNFDIDRDNLFRQSGSVDEHLNRSMRGSSRDNW